MDWLLISIAIACVFVSCCGGIFYAIFWGGKAHVNVCNMGSIEIYIQYTHWISFSFSGFRHTMYDILAENYNRPIPSKYMYVRSRIDDYVKVSICNVVMRMFDGNRCF